MVSHQGEAPRTLVVDDDDLVRTVLRTALERIGHQVTEAADREAAISAAALMTFDLVIIDARMPGLSLSDTLTGIRSRQEPHRGGVLVISGAPVDDAVLTEHGASYLAKPVDLGDFMTSVRSATS